MKAQLFLVVQILSFITAVLCRGQERILQQLSDKKVDPRIRPKGFNDTSYQQGPVIVHIDCYINWIRDLNEKEQTFEFQLTFRMKWMDVKLSYNKQPDIGFLTLTNDSSIWTPDAYFTNEITGYGHDVLRPNTLVRVHPDGTVLLSRRLNLKVSCPMDLVDYPFDSQYCGVRISSFAYGQDELHFLWKEENPVQASKNIFMPKFTLKRPVTTHYCTSRTTSGDNTCLRMDFLFERSRSYYVKHWFLPSIVWIGLAWISFWFHYETKLVPRLAFCLIALVTLTNKIMKINTQIPFTRYSKAIDSWNGWCFAFALIPLVEFFVVHYISSEAKNGQDCDDEKSNGVPVIRVEESETDIGPKQRALEQIRTAMRRVNASLKQFPIHERVDLIFRIGYPIVFALFNLCFWASNL